MELTEFDYVFLCVDQSDVRQLVLRALSNTEVNVIDVGMGLNFTDEQEFIWGTCRLPHQPETSRSHVSPRQTALKSCTDRTSRLHTSTA